MVNDLKSLVINVLKGIQFIHDERNENNYEFASRYTARNDPAVSENIINAVAYLEDCAFNPAVCYVVAKFERAKNYKKFMTAFKVFYVDELTREYPGAIEILGEVVTDNDYVLPTRISKGIGLGCWTVNLKGAIFVDEDKLKKKTKKKNFLVI